MNDDMDITRSTWIAAVKLAIVLSVVAALVAVAVSSMGNAVVAPVMIVAFAASWVQTGRVHRESARPAVLVLGR